MAKTYCGKDCSLCVEREQLGCIGCTDEKNRIQYKECEIANCCCQKGHEGCTTCSYQETCSTVEKRNTMPSYRIEQQALVAERKANALRKAPFMSKWLKILFWVMIVSTVADIFADDNVAKLLPELSQSASIISTICTILYAVVLFKLSAEEPLYRTSAYCILAGVVISGLALFTLLDDTSYLVGALVFALLAMVLTFAGEYYEYKAHANAVRDASAEMAEKWEELWNYFIKLLIALVVCMLLSPLLSFVAAVIVIILAIGMIVISVMKITYVHETAKIFEQLQ